MRYPDDSISRVIDSVSDYKILLKFEATDFVETSDAVSLHASVVLVKGTVMSHFWNTLMFCFFSRLMGMQQNQQQKY